MKLTFLTNDIYDDYEYVDQENKCYLCNANTMKFVTTILQKTNNICKTCELCNFIVNFKKSYIGKFIFVYSKLNQEIINKKTMDYYKKYNKIPLPIEIDNKCKFIKISPFILSKIFDICLFDDIQYFKNYKIMFTGEMFRKNYQMKNVFVGGLIQQKKYDNEYFDLELHDFTDIELKVINKYSDLINKMNNILSMNIQSSLNSKIKDLI